ncbi:hypothetical protein D8O27_06965 [Burkholderia mallei]|uniref:Lipoprotein n=1 Tax=Burkholderia mallei TaxID=13373 RepID=A0AAX1XAE7_BURML|nr:conserved hypothetical protein [Burkholderia mallei 2002721280]RKO00620.1 hypothetical protein D8O31_06925 [Burkholderia mallei]RKO05115.1 hypothetical protein D8O05_11970 [Burkholderia mallei]RKO05451.1 hypothetical protein D8O03_06365 [Burkholderia mallei]RKO14015.1 hypothetical protein D8O04_10330 [Burkholderia mallei]
MSRVACRVSCFVQGAENAERRHATPGRGACIPARDRPESHYNPTFVPMTAPRTMLLLRHAILTALAATACAIAIVTGVGGAATNLREYLAARERDRYRYLADHPLDCRVSEDGRASGCTGLAYLRRERVSVYDDGDDTVQNVVARVDLDHGTYPAIIAVQKRDVRCEQ